MATVISDYAKNKIALAIMAKQALPVTNWYLALFTAGGGAITTREIVAAGYARVSVPADLTNWGATATPGLVSNNADILFPQPTADWPEATYIGLFDAATNGNLWFYNELGRAKAFFADDDPPKIRAGEITFTFTAA